jgi:hypothetical protein
MKKKKCLKKMIKKMQCTVREKGWGSYPAYKTNVECIVGLFQQAKYNFFYLFLQSFSI